MMFAQANSEHCRHKIFNARWIVDGAAAGAQPVRDDPAHARGNRAGGTVVAYADNAAVMEGATVRRFYPDAEGCYAGAHGADAHADEGGDAQSPDGDRAVSRRRDGLRRRDPRRGGDRHRVRSRRRGSPASPCRTCGCRRCRNRGSLPYGKPDRIASALDIMLEGPIGGASFNNEFGRPESARLFPHLRAGGRGRSPRLPQADHDRRRRGQHTRRPHGEARDTRWRAADPARRARHADRPGRRRGVVDGHRRQYRRPRLRFGPAWQCRNPATRAGGDRSVLAAGRGESDPVDPRRRGGRSVERVSGARSTAAARARCSTCASCRRRSRAWRRARSGATRRRSATCSRFAPEDRDRFAAICARERCPFAVVGTANRARTTRRRGSAFRQSPPVDMDLDVLFGKPPKMTRECRARKARAASAAISPA